MSVFLGNVAQQRFEGSHVANFATKPVDQFSGLGFALFDGSNP